MLFPDLDPAFLRKVKTRRDLSKADQEVKKYNPVHHKNVFFVLFFYHNCDCYKFKYFTLKQLSLVK